MSRISQYFAEHPQKKSLIAFVTAGDPSVEHTVPAMHALVAGGVDIIELGVPFSDPEAEGPAIQASSERALANGVTLNGVLDMVRQFRQQNNHTPIVLMGYLNSVMAHADFAQQGQAAGVDGLIMVNLPPEAAAEIQRDLSDHDIDLVYLVAPTTTAERAQYILSQAAGFVYYVSLKGITGADNINTAEVAERVAELKKHTQLPVCVGFGIKDANSAQQVAAVADGVVVGSALVNLLAEHVDDVASGCEALTQATLALRQGVDQPH